MFICIHHGRKRHSDRLRLAGGDGFLVMGKVVAPGNCGVIFIHRAIQANRLIVIVIIVDRDLQHLFAVIIVINPVAHVDVMHV